MTGSIRFAVPMLLSATVLLSGCDREKGPKAPPAETLVHTSVVKRQPFEKTVSIDGEIVPRVQSDLSFRISGRMIERLVDVGDPVKKGQVLARLDPATQKADVSSATAAVASAEAQLAQAQSTYERQKALVAKGITTRKDYEQAEQALVSGKAAVDAAQAALKSANEVLGYNELRSDVDGVILTRAAESGQVVQAAQTIYSVAVAGPRDAVFDLSEAMLLHPPDKVAVKVSLVNDPSVTVIGDVRQVSPTINKTTGTVRAKVGLEAVPDAMKFGSVVTGTGTISEDAAFVLPWTAMTSVDRKPAVWIFDPKTSQVTLRAVEISSYATQKVIVSAGLQDGETIVTDGTKLLRPNQTVKPVEE